MKISIDWLKSLLPLELPAEELSERLRRLGFETASLERLGASFSGVVVGKVLAVEKHPNADRLSVCSVSDGAETLSVVCGAPNVAAGQTVALAKVGASLPNDLKIKKSKIRGQESSGMICSAAELGLAEPVSPGILVLPEETPLGSDFAALAGPADAVLDLEITPNRPDCLSHRGIARELAVSLGLRIHEKPLRPFPETAPAPSAVSIESPEDCPRYLGRIIQGIKIAPSPDWLQRRLKTIGLRPINNVVDATNFFLHETGQPLHAFDLNKLKGPLKVRAALPGETIRALDGKEYSLPHELLVIADESGPTALAGVIGGLHSAVSDATTSIFLECAAFKPGKIRRASKAVSIRTDSSHRFERGVDSASLAEALDSATALILELAGGSAGPRFDSAPDARPPIRVACSSARINEILGTAFQDDRIRTILSRIGVVETSPSGTFTVLIPSHRLDLSTPWDLAEEIARHLGYDSIPESSAAVRIPDHSPDRRRECGEALRDSLCGFGFYETYHRDMVSEAALSKYLGLNPHASRHPKLKNPLSEEWAFLRPSLLINLLKTTALNFNRGAQSLRLFEIGKTYFRDSRLHETAKVAGILAGDYPAKSHWTGPGAAPDFFTVKGVVESLLKDYRFQWRSAEAPGTLYHPKACLDIMIGNKRCGTAGLIHPEAAKAWDLSDRPAALFEFDIEELGAWKIRRARLSTISPFPSAWRDVSILVGQDLPFAEIERCLNGLKLETLQSLCPIDVFEGESLPAGKKSLTLRLSFSHPQRTLTDDEVAAAVSAFLEAARSACSAELRA